MSLVQIIGLALQPLALVSLFLHARGLLRRATSFGRRVGLVAPLIDQPTGPPLEDLAATLRRVHPAVRSPRAETTPVRQQGILAAYAGVLVAAAAALGVPTAPADLPEGLTTRRSGLRLEHELQRAGLSWQPSKSGRPPQSEAE